MFHTVDRASMCRLAALLMAFFGLGAAREAAALPLAYEGFQYVPAQPLPTMAGGSGWAPGPWTGSAQMVDQPPTLSYPTALASLGDALQNPAAGEAWRYFGAPFNNAASDLWISFQEETAAAGSGAFVDLVPVSGPDIQVNKNGLGAIALNGLAAGLSAGVGNVDFFVLQVRRFSGGVSLINLYVNPGAVLGPPSATFITPLVYQANQFYYRTDPGQLLDEIRVGTTPQDVAAASVGVPTLTVAQSGNGVIVSWPDTGNFTLQQNSDLTAPAGWGTSGYAVTTANGINSITTAPPTGNLFFRLANP
jgi:hypothetical protein